MKKLLFIPLLFAGITALAQNVGIGTSTPNPNAILDLGAGNRGLLLPQVSNASMTGMVTPPPGLVLFNTNLGRPYMYVGTWRKVMLDDDQFSLPYTNGGNSSDYLFDVFQGISGTGSAIRGRSLAGGTGVRGISETGYAVQGTATSGTGGYFSSTSGRALQASGPVWLNGANGNTMIGNLTVAEMPLHISNASDTALLLLDNNTALSNGSNVGAYFKNGSWYTGAIKTTGTGSSVARMSFWTFASGSVNGLRERMSILDNGNIGINTTNPQTTLDVNGTVKISGGSPGANKVLTSDASGLASWKGVTGFAARRTGTLITINPSSSGTIVFNTEEYDLGTPGYNTTTGQYTVPETGVYHFDISLAISPQVNPQTIILSLVKNATTIRQTGIVTTNTFSATGLSLSCDVFLTQGDVIECNLLNFSPTNGVVIGFQFSTGNDAGSSFNGHLVR